MEEIFNFFGGRRNTAGLLAILLIFINGYLKLGLSSAEIYSIAGTAVGVSLSIGIDDAAKSFANGKK